MPRKKEKITIEDIQIARGGWYQFHYEKRQKYLALPINTQHIYEHAAMRISPPRLTIYGGLPGDYPSREELEILGTIQGMADFDLANPWYVSQAGWEAFQQLWTNMPEPVNLYTAPGVQIGAVVHIVHNQGELSPGERG